MRKAFVIGLFLVLLSSIAIAQTLKGVNEACTSGTECKSGFCVATNAEVTQGVCASTTSPASTASPCVDGPVPLAGCKCGGIAIGAGACKGGIFYYPPYQSGKAFGESCTDGNQCSTGICFLGKCAYRTLCTSQSPGYCDTQDDCLAVSGKWCTYVSGGSSCSVSCPTCASDYLSQCATQSSCTAVGGYWCSNQCSSVACPSQSGSTNQSTDLCSGVTCNSPPNSQCYYSPGTCSAGSCSYSKKSDGTPCDDSNPSTTGDKCTNGVCSGTQANATNKGACMVRDAYTSTPLFSAPDIGKGYAKNAKDANTIEGLRTACTKTDYDELLKNYCTQNSNTVQQQVVVYYPDGNAYSSGCGASGCDFYSCSSTNTTTQTNQTASSDNGACVVRDSYTSLPLYTDPDLGKGYAKKTKGGINTIDGLKTACTKADYDDLLQKYCAQNNRSVQQGVVTYGPGGGWSSSSCGAFGCEDHSCPAGSGNATSTTMPPTNATNATRPSCPSYSVPSCSSVTYLKTNYDSQGCAYYQCVSSASPSTPAASGSGAGGGGGAGGLISTCAQVITPAMDAAGNCREYTTSCLPPGWNKVDKCPGRASTCGNAVCEPGESSLTCPGDCKGKYLCGNGLCEPDMGESYLNCPQDCQRADCPVHQAPVCERGFAMAGPFDDKGCRGPPTCCGDSVCSGGENSQNCRQDCIGAEPDRIQCPDGSYAACKVDARGVRYCEPCRIVNLPAGCRQEVEKETGFVKVVCESIQRICPSFSMPQNAKQICEQKGGIFNIRKDYNGCEFPDCSFGEVSSSPIPVLSFRAESRCLIESKEQREAKKQECEKLGLGYVISVQGECKISKCVPKEQKSGCQPISEQQQKIESECRQRGLSVVKDFDQSGCAVLKCGEISQCFKDLPTEAYEKCGSQGGELVIRRNEQGCIMLSQCIRKADVRQAYVEPIEKIPESADILSMAFKMEELRIELDKLAKKTDDIANYYASANSPDEGRYRRVSNMFSAAKSKVDEIKDKLRNVAQKTNPTEDDLIEVKRDVRYIKDVMMKDAIYVMLSSSDDVKSIKESQAVKVGDKFEEVNITDDTNCGSDNSCFDRAFRLCKKVVFYPEGKQGSKVEIRGLEGDACIMYAVTPDTGELPPEIVKEIKPPYDMTCRIKNYALGMQITEKDILSNCEGPMVELTKKFKEQGGVQEELSKPAPAAIAAPPPAAQSTARG
ncbi:MAG: hypothetical protein HYW26_04715 [Candidatus Aenigmarchaeota archaeon]|nr:hypothetical protein [Candidatus Aenigmarchaeota archaeon]